MSDKPVKGINIPLSLEKPDNWEDIKHGFTQANKCNNCGNEWSEQLEWNMPAINSIIGNDYCTDCYSGQSLTKLHDKLFDTVELTKDDHNLLRKMSKRYAKKDK